MKVIVDLLLIAIIMVNIIDISGFINEMESLLAKYLNVRRERVHIPKPFSCSYCMTHWFGILYLLICGELTLFNYCMILMICFITPLIKEIQYLMYEIITYTISRISNLF